MPLAIGSSFTKASAGASSVKRMYRGTVSAWNADAADWVSRVYAAGASVSSSTANAVTAFCNAIDSAGLRGSFARLNLFCGSSITAALIPLYRSSSYGGAVLGGATDTNNNFVSADYVETGASGGITGNATTKYLNTGFATQNLPGVNDCHLAVWSPAASVTETRRLIGAFGASGDNYIIDRRLQAGGGNSVRLGGTANFQTSVFDADTQSMIASRTSSTSAILYKNASSVATQTTTLSGVTLTSQVIGVFAGLSGGTTAGGFYPHRLCGYSLGGGLTAQQVASFHDAWQAFQAALGRQV